MKRRLTGEEAFITFQANMHNKIAYIQIGKKGKKTISIFDKDGVSNIDNIDVVYFDKELTKKMKKENANADLIN